VREDEMSVREAALLLGVSEETVRRRFDDGTLTGRRTKPAAGGWRILDRASVEAYGRRQRGEEDADG
jgi:excisionase family DNA binding protein